MNLYTFYSIKPYVIDVFCHVYGAKYQDYISKKINYTCIIPYYNTHDSNLSLEQIKELNYSSILQSLSSLSYTSEFVQKIENMMDKESICLLSDYSLHSTGNLISFLLFTFRKSEKGLADFVFLHECGHAIDKGKENIGFDLISRPDLVNPYDSQYRKYEKFNEAINDIFTEEATSYLHENNIYLLEPKETTRDTYQEVSSYPEVRRILLPLVTNYREDVIAAKIYGIPSLLTQKIGTDCYEELVDIVNQVDYLCRNELHSNATNNTIYQTQLERAANVYSAIDEKSGKQFSNYTKEHFYIK